jgi:pyruvate dehydrogenase E2 component (dihydrolipoamide acetyltransferase)
MTDILMPALSPTMEEGGLAKWLVKPGDTVASGDIIAEIETDKATMEVEAVDEGVVEALLVEAGAQGVKVGTPIARLKGDGEASPSSPQTSQAAPAPPAPPKGEQPKPAPVPAPTPGPTAPPKAEQQGMRVFASPLARRLAEQNGVDLSAVKGSGPHGRIIKRDLEGAPKGAAPKAAPQPQPAAAGAPAPQAHTLEQLGIAPGSYDLVPLDGMKRTIARRMTEAVQTIPSFPLTVDLEIDALLAARSAVNAILEKDGVKVSVNDMVIKAAAMALMRVREANASYTPDGIAMHHHADVAVAVAVEGGLITPIVRSADTKGLAQIAVEMKDLAERARSRKLAPEEYQGGTFSVSNLGMMGIQAFGSIINAPQGAILSVGVGERRPIVRAGDKLEIATLMTVTMTCDHRVIDGATGARWLAAFKTMIEQPAAMLA